MGKSLTVRIPDVLQKELESISKTEKTSISDLVRKSIDHFVVVKKFKKLRSKILPFAEAQGLLTDEDIFREFS